jgi:hypothetical protein
MSTVWPYDAKVRYPFDQIDPLRPFRCLLFMPYKSDFAVVTELIKTQVNAVAEKLFQVYGMHDLPEIKRIEWIKSSGVIQDQIWRELLAADLVICDITEYNPNVMFEAGVAAGWKPIHKVIFIKNKFPEVKHPFDISPFRYIEYDLSDQGIAAFKDAITIITQDAIFPFPDEQIFAPKINLPFTIDFSEGLDDLRLYTPPYCHRRVVNGAFQFGSIFSYAHSWVSIGNAKLLNFRLQFDARFAIQTPKGSMYKIGVGLRSQHFYANYEHVLVLATDGSIVITEPNNDLPMLYSNIDIRSSIEFDPYIFHVFDITFDEKELSIAIDDFSCNFATSEMKRVFGPGLIRFHATRTWMDIRNISINDS